jgi:chemotaxis protein MotA
MDIMTLFGFMVLVLVIAASYFLGELPLVLFNFHAVLLVIGGTLIATMINTPKKYFLKAIKAFSLVFISGEYEDIYPAINHIVELSEKARKNGLKTLKEADENIANGFLKRACDAVVEYGDQNFVKNILEKEINQSFEELNEVSNVYRTMSLLSPMFGLIGTLIGIIGVLKDLSNPAAVGPAMAIAITSAFYGILLSNLLFVPVAGKIRAKAIMRLKLKEMILEGVLEIMKGSIPLMIERRMKTYAEDRF